MWRILRTIAIVLMLVLMMACAAVLGYSGIGFGE